MILKYTNDYRSFNEKDWEDILLSYIEDLLTNILIMLIMKRN